MRNDPESPDDRVRCADGSSELVDSEELQAASEILEARELRAASELASERTRWTASAHPIQQAARGIVAHYEGEAWKWPEHEFAKRVNEVARLIAASPESHALLCEAVEEYDNHGPNVMDAEWLDRVRTLIAKVKDG